MPRLAPTVFFRTALPLPRAVRFFAVSTAILAAFSVQLQAAPDAPAKPPPVKAPPVKASPVKAPPVAISAARQADDIVVLPIHGPIDAITASSFARRMDAAEASGAGAIVVELNTPGGELGALFEISKRLKRSSVHTVAWVRDDAYSAGALTALACREIVVTPVATLGDAAPVTATPFGGMQTLGRTERAKVLSPILADVTDSARRNGYDEKLVQAFVALDISLWLAVHRQTGQRLVLDKQEHDLLFGSGAAPSVVSGTGFSPASAALRSLLSGRPVPESTTLQEQIDTVLTRSTTRPSLTASDRGSYQLIGKVHDGSTLLTLKSPELLSYGLAVQTVADDAELIVFFGAKHVHRLPESWSERAVRVLTSVPVKMVLVVLFVLGALVEMLTPGTGLAGGVSALALLGLAAPPLFIGAAGWWSLAAVVTGVVFLATEVFVLPGFGVFGITGLCCVIGGLAGLFVGAQDPFMPSHVRFEGWLYAIASVLLATLTALGLGVFLSRRLATVSAVQGIALATSTHAPGAYASEPSPAPLPSPGTLGASATALRPGGEIEIDGTRLDAVSDEGYIDAGTAVRVLRVEGSRVFVAPCASAP